MRVLLWFSIHVALCWSAVLQDITGRGAQPRDTPPPLECGSLTVPRDATPIHIDLQVWGRGMTEYQWSGDIAVGNPPQIFNVVFDTGAAALLLPRSNCTTCGGHHNLFDPSSSGTFSAQPGVWIEGLFAGATGHTIPSTDPQGANCTAVTDTVHVGDRQAQQQQFLLCDVYSPGLAEQLADGIFGLGSTRRFSFGPWTNFSTAYGNLLDSGTLRRPEFGFSLIETNTRSGRLTLGGTDPSLYIPGTLKTIPLDWPLSESRGSWVVGVQGARIGGSLLANSTDSVTLVDTGAAVVVTPDVETTRNLYALMSDQIQPIAGCRGCWGAPCDVLDQAVRDVTFTLGGAGGGGPGQEQVDVTLDKAFINVGEYPGVPGLCQGVFLDPPRPAREPLQGRRAWIVGSPLLRSYYTVWNSEERTLGFASPSVGGGERRN